MSLRLNRRFVPPIRFSLRVALICMTVACIGFGFVSNKCLNRRKAFAILAEHGAVVDTATPQHWQHFTAPLPTELTTTVSEIRIHGNPAREPSPVHNDAVWAVSQFPEIRELRVTNSRLDLAQCQSLTQLPKLERLSLHGSRLPEDALSMLANHSTLVDVSLAFTNVSDSHCKAMVQCSAIGRVDVAATLVTDVGLREIAELPNLSMLFVSPDYVTPSGIEYVLSRHPTMLIQCRGPENFGDEWWTTVRQRYPGATIRR